MLKKYWKLIAIMVLVGAVLCVAASVEKGKKKAKQLAPSEAAKEQEAAERKVTEAEVPAAALAALKKLAAGAEITEFAEEIEYSHTFYEGSWKNPAGANMDVIVTPTGDLVEIEEQMSTDQVPAAVLKMAQSAAGKDTPLTLEKKTTILYEVKFQKDDSLHELLLSPDGRHVEEKVEKGTLSEEEKEEEK